MCPWGDLCSFSPAHTPVLLRVLYNFVCPFTALCAVRFSKWDSASIASAADDDSATRCLASLHATLPRLPPCHVLPRLPPCHVASPPSMPRVASTHFLPRVALPHFMPRCRASSQCDAPFCITLSSTRVWIVRYPYPIIEVDQGVCYRFRMIMMASNAENYVIRLAGVCRTFAAMATIEGVVCSVLLSTGGCRPPLDLCYRAR
jgi:hypothetical protein